eukprot:13932470-Alexandrium_andersonii.AAC.1
MPRQFLTPDQWRKAVSAPVAMLAQVMDRAAYHGDMGWKMVTTETRGSKEECLEGYMRVAATALDKIMASFGQGATFVAR